MSVVLVTGSKCEIKIDQMSSDNLEITQMSSHFKVSSEFDHSDNQHCTENHWQYWIASVEVSYSGLGLRNYVATFENTRSKVYNYYYPEQSLGDFNLFPSPWIDSSKFVFSHNETSISHIWVHGIRWFNVTFDGSKRYTVVCATPSWRRLHLV